MILVLADDLSGAAELAGAAAAAGLTAEVQTRFAPQSGAQVIALDTATRSLSAEEAAKAVSRLASPVVQARPAWIYKKTDSVLRGHVRVEIEALLAATGLRRSLFIPANPSKDRVIRDGRCFVQGLPLDQTAFARDPEHPRWTAEVSELLGASELIELPDVNSVEQVRELAGRVEDTTLPAGGVDFFEALLVQRGVVGAATAGHAALRAGGAGDGRQALFVCGSAAAWELGRARQGASRGVPVLPMPDVLFTHADAPALEAWVDAVSAAIDLHGVAMIAIGSGPAATPGAPSRSLANTLAQAVVRLLRQTCVRRLLLEGGATATAVLQARDWTRLHAGCPLAPGIATLQPEGAGEIELLIKPGSYDWPEVVWPVVSAARKDDGRK